MKSPGRPVTRLSVKDRARVSIGLTGQNGGTAPASHLQLSLSLGMEEDRQEQSAKPIQRDAETAKADRGEGTVEALDRAFEDS